ncbi:MAG: hypothetical protein LBH64_05500, partial [Coriobacteriales bacterium]|nr:hypothetical protein [Coriobacteriales bacterium]
MDRLPETSELAPSQSDGTTVHIGYRQPYRYDLLLDFLAFRAIAGVEVVRDGVYSRSVSLPLALAQLDAASPLGADSGNAKVGWIQVRDLPERNCLALTLSAGLSSLLPLVNAKVKWLFDTDCEPDVIRKGLAAFYQRVPASCRLEGIRLPGSFDGFEMAVRAILGQQITVKAANTLAGRLAARFGETIPTPIEGLSLIFPQASAFCAEGAAECLGELGVIRSRARAICALAQAVTEGGLELRPGVDVEATCRALCALPGIGEWTARYIAMRALGHPDAFLTTDYAVKKAFKDLGGKELERLSEDWRPWRSYAVMS